MEKQGQGQKLGLDHIVKERYPTFVDALRDLDDALSLLSLFANLPATSIVPPNTIALCQRLCLEWQQYLIRTHSLRKSFLSVKGIYYQAEVQGQDVLWLVPYKFVQRVTGDVDFRIMGTFVDFYTTLLGFVNYRLYTAIGLVYPPKFDAKSDEQGGELSTLTLEGRGIDELQQIANGENTLPNSPSEAAPPSSEKLQTIQQQIASIYEFADPSTIQSGDQSTSDQAPPSPPTDTIDTFPTPFPSGDTLPQPAISSTTTASLFAPFTIYLSRETPRQPLEFLLRAFGCTRIGWDFLLGPGAYTSNEHDPAITHQIVDRPPPSAATNAEQRSAQATMQDAGTVVPANHRLPGRIYVQPQWVWDCANGVKLLRPDLYAPGATLPPHLSPWVKPRKRVYDPTVPLAEQEREGEADEVEAMEDGEGMEEEEDEEAEEGGEPAEAVAGGFDKDIDMSIASSVSESDSDVNISSLHSAASGTSSFAGFEHNETQLPNPNTQLQRDLEAEAAGLPFTTSQPSPLKSILKKPPTGPTEHERTKRAEVEELERRLMMMGRKKRKLVEKMMHGNAVKEVEAERLRAKRRRVEAQQ